MGVVLKATRYFVVDDEGNTLRELTGEDAKIQAKLDALENAIVELQAKLSSIMG